jgi:hypothetical protein
MKTIEILKNKLLFLEEEKNLLKKGLEKMNQEKKCVQKELVCYYVKNTSPLILFPIGMFLVMIIFLFSNLCCFYGAEKNIKVYEKGVYAINAKSWMFKKMEKTNYTFIEIND